MRYALAFLAFTFFCFASAQDRIPADDVSRLVRDLIGELKKGSERGTDFRSGNSPGDEAMDALVMIGEPAVPALIAGLNSEDEWTRALSAECLRLSHAKEATQPLIGAIANEKSAAVKSYLVHALGATGGRSMVDRLISLSESTDRDVASCAILALGETGDPATIPLLMKHLKDKGLSMPSAMETLSYNASTALAKIGSPAFDALKAALASPDEEVRETAARALSGMKDRRVNELILDYAKDPAQLKLVSQLIGFEPDPALSPAFLAMLSSSDLEIRLGAAWTFKHLQDKRFLPALCQCLRQTGAIRTGQDSKSRYNQLRIIEELADALYYVGDSTTIGVVKQVLEELGDHADRGLDGQLINLLVHFKDRSSEALFLKNALRTDELAPRERNSHTLAGAAGCGVVGLRAMTKLAEAYKARRIDAEVYAAALDEVDDVSCLPILKAALSDEVKDVRRVALWAIGGIRNKEASAILIDLMKAPDRASDAAEQLLRQHDESGLRFFFDHDFHSYQSRSELREIFGGFQTEVLARACDKLTPSLRVYAAEVLAIRKQDQGFRTLERLIVSGIPEVACVAIDSVTKLKHRQSCPVLLQALARDEIPVRVAALRALQTFE